MTNDQSTNQNESNDKNKKEMSRSGGSGEEENTRPSDKQAEQNDDDENGDEANEDDDDDDDDDNKSNSTKNSKSYSQVDNSCISCKKFKNSKKKPRSTKSSRRIGLRAVPKKYFSLPPSKQAIVRVEFNLDIPERSELSEAPRIRLCLECFKRLLARLNELLAEELKLRQEEPKPLEQTPISDDEYHDYDDDEDQISESSEDPQENKITSTTQSPNKQKIESVSPTEQITTCQTAFDSSFQSIENSKEKTKILKTNHDNNNNTVDAKAAPAKQISEVINDAIKTALQVSINVIERPKSPADSPISSTSSQNSTLFGSITKGTPMQQETKAIEPKPVEKRDILLNKANDTPEVSNGYNVLNEIISKQLITNLTKISENKTSATTPVLAIAATQQTPPPQPTQQPQPQPPTPPTQQPTLPNQPQEGDIDGDRKYTLGRWVDTIIVKMNDKPVEEIDLQNFKEQLPMSSTENSAAANLLKVKKSQNEESSCSSVASSPEINKNKQEILIESEDEEQVSNVEQNGDEKSKESQIKIRNRIESIIENELANSIDDQTNPRSRTSSLTMKLLQENLSSTANQQQHQQQQQQQRPTPSPKRQSPNERSENWIGSMFNLGGLVMKSLNEDLPPPINIPSIDPSRSPHVKPGQYPHHRPPSPTQNKPGKQTKDLNLIVQARSYAQPGPGPTPPAPTIPSSPSPSGKKSYPNIPQKIPPAQPVPHRPTSHQQYLN